MRIHYVRMQVLTDGTVETLGTGSQVFLNCKQALLVAATHWNKGAWRYAITSVEPTADELGADAREHLSLASSKYVN